MGLSFVVSPLRLFLVLLMLPFLGNAATTNTIFNYTNQLWKFTPAPQTNDAWKQPQFDDSGWSNGFSVFSTAPNETLNPAAVSAGAAIKTQLSTNHQGKYVVTYYYRTKFTITNDPAALTLVFSNMVDDGAVFYVNGQEIRRTRMPDGLITSTNYATSSIEVANLNETFSISGNVLIRQENTLAVEVHQASPVGSFPSPDSVFGLALSLFSVENEPPTITGYSGNLSLEYGAATNIFVEYASSSPVTFTWYFDGNRIPEAASNILAIPFVTRGHEGLYRLVLSNEYGSTTSALMQVSVNLPVYIALHSEWRYSPPGFNPGSNWFEPSYDDSSWLQGPGVFGRENSQPAASLIRTELSLTNSQGQGLVTHYFRKAFVASPESGLFQLTVTNLIDDGAIFYLNGQEVFRTNMQNGPVAYGQVASGTIGEANFESFSIPAERLLAGTNIFAVQLAQSTSTSSDVVFGMTAAITRTPPSSLSITSAFADVEMEEGMHLALQTAVSGSGGFVRWYKDGNLLSGRQATTLLLDGLRSESGNYFYTVSNQINAVTSRIANINIIPDVTPPFIVTAVNSNGLLYLEFNEPLNALRTNASNYILSSWNGLEAPLVTSVLFTTPTNAIVQLNRSLPSGVNFNLTLENVEDRFGNTFSSLPAPIRSFVVFFNLQTHWRFWAHTNPPPADWTALDFDDTTWSGARPGFPSFAPFGFSINPPDFIGATTLSRGSNRVTTYFRKGFLLSNISPSGLQVSMSVESDDGAAFYLNGEEFLRLRLPQGLLTSSTLAAQQGRPILEGPFQIPYQLLRSGINVLAVELHQDTPTFDDTWFAAKMEGTFASYATGPVHFVQEPTSQSVAERGPFILNPVATAADKFQWYREGQPIPNATNASYFAKEAHFGTHDGNYYLVAGNDQFNATSSMATVQILADTTPPMLVSANFSNDFREIWLAFSEPMAKASATNFANFQITNRLGQTANLQGILHDGSNIILNVAEADPGYWTVSLGPLQDTARSRNPLLPSSRRAAIGFIHRLLPFSAEWKYFPATSEMHGWTSNSFNDSTWPTGSGLFGTEGEVTFDQIRTPLEPLVRGAHYFRRQLLVPTIPDSIVLLSYYVDDGAVIYQNGSRILGIRMPSVVAWNTLASGGPVEGPIEATVDVTELFQPGEHFLSAEVHQTSNNPTDLIFALEIQIKLLSTILP